MHRQRVHQAPGLSSPVGALSPHSLPVPGTAEDATVTSPGHRRTGRPEPRVLGEGWTDVSRQLSQHLFCSPEQTASHPGLKAAEKPSAAQAPHTPLPSGTPRTWLGVRLGEPGAQAGARSLLEGGDPSAGRKTQHLIFRKDLCKHINTAVCHKILTLKYKGLIIVIVK